jgi:hypothetical protein
MLSTTIALYMLVTAPSTDAHGTHFAARWPQHEFGPLIFDYFRVHEVVKGPECRWTICEIS